MSSIDRREFLARMAAGGSALAAAATPRGLADLDSKRMPPDERRLAPAQAGLADPAFRPLAPGVVRPRGWLERQLRIQADGLSGHLDLFWPDVARSGWFGGDAEGWERAPYWLDGVIPLAWTLDDQALKARIHGYMNHIVRNQRPDGIFQPMAAQREGAYDLWAILLADKVLSQYHAATGDERVLAALVSSLRSLQRTVAGTPLFRWGKYRWFEGLVPIFYAYERTGEAWLLDLARRLRDQGTDYGALYRTDDVTVPTPRRGRWTWDKHVVNTAMAPKAGALSWRLDRRPEDRELPNLMLAVLDRFHGQVTGMFTGDECLAGRNPVQGTELCAVVEMLYSLEVLTSVFGDAAFADRLERIAFNALPATFTPHMWAHQYDQQVNQVQCTINPDHMWTTNGPESNLYGLEPNYGCCTANMHQGWPKFAGHLWMEAPGGGMAAVAYAPSEVHFRSGDVPVAIVSDTDYPFRDAIALTVTSEREVSFPLLLRVPGWTEGATISVGGRPPAVLRPGTWHRVERTWRGPTRLDLRFPMRPRVTVRYAGAVAVERGPLVYSLFLEEEWTRVNADEPHRELPHGDFEVRPVTPWNYGLLVDPDAPEEALSFEERPVGARPFSPEGAGMRVRARGRRLPGWKIEHGWAGEIAPGPNRSEEPLEELTLIPYGCTNIRVTEFPRLTE